MQAQWEIGKCPCDKEEVVLVWDLSKSMQTFALVKASRKFILTTVHCIS